MCKILQSIGAFLRRHEPSDECPLCKHLMHSGRCDVCGGDPANVTNYPDSGREPSVICHKCGLYVDGLDGPFSCQCQKFWQ